MRAPRAAAFARICALFFATFTASCHRDPPPEGAPSAAVSTSPQATEVAAHAPSPRVSDERWARALGDDDPLEDARLADALGAEELASGVRDGGAVATAALRALPYASDALLALGPLMDAALDAQKGLKISPATGEPWPTTAALLDAVAAIALARPEDREPFAAESVAHAIRILVGLSAEKGLSEDDHARVVSALRGLANRGFFDPTKIPD